MCLCYLGALETLDFTKNEGSGLDPRPPPLNLDTYCALSLTLSLALERGYPRANIIPSQCLSLEDPAVSQGDMEGQIHGHLRSRAKFPEPEPPVFFPGEPGAHPVLFPYGKWSPEGQAGM